MAIRRRSNPHSTEAHLYTGWKSCGMGRNLPAGGVFCRSGLGDDGKVRALVAALGGGFWTWWFWLGVAGLGLIVPMLLNRGQSQFRHSCRAGGVWGRSGGRVDVAINFILYAGHDGGGSEKVVSTIFLKSVFCAVVKSRGRRVHPVDGLCGSAVALACHDATHLHRHCRALRAPAAGLWRTDVLFAHQRFLGHLCRQHSYSLLSWEFRLAAVWAAIRFAAALGVCCFPPEARCLPCIIGSKPIRYFR
ncbi:NrfD/PsrC family molybdoenzyme membrane anchor subunit [Shigella flexneri]